MVLIDLLEYQTIIFLILRHASELIRLSQLEIALHQLLTQRPELFDHHRIRGMRRSIAHLTIM
jgi:hypothetical protein